MSTCLASALLAATSILPASKSQGADEPTVGFYMTAEPLQDKDAAVMRCFGTIADFVSGIIVPFTSIFQSVFRLLFQVNLQNRFGDGFNVF